MVLEEQPAKMAEALRYFLQGIGYGNYFQILFIILNYSSHEFSHSSSQSECHTPFVVTPQWRSSDKAEGFIEASVTRSRSRYFEFNSFGDR